MARLYPGEVKQQCETQSAPEDGARHRRDQLAAQNQAVTEADFKIEPGGLTVERIK